MLADFIKEINKMSPEQQVWEAYRQMAGFPPSWIKVVWRMI